MSSDNHRIKNLLNEARKARNNGHYKLAKDLLDKAYALTPESIDTNILIQIINDRARIERDLGNSETSLEYYESLFELEDKLQNKTGIAHALRHMGDIYLDQNRLSDAEKCYNKVIEIYNTLPEVSRESVPMANTFRSLALLNEKRNLTNEAITYWKMALKIYENHNLEPGIEECNNAFKRSES